MSCLCQTHTLRLFVRSLAHVDLPTSVIRPSIHTQGTAVKRPFHLQTIRQLHSTPARLEFSSQTSSSNDAPSTESTSSSESTESAVAEISLESIDQIAAEMAADLPTDTSPYMVSRDEPPPRPSRTPRAAVAPEPGFRRAKGLGIDFESGTAQKAASKADKPRWTEERKEARRSMGKAPAKPERREGRASSSRDTERPRRDDWTPPPREHWQIDKAALKEKFPDGWNPRKRLSPDALAGIRALHAQMPQEYNTAALAATFEVSPEDIRRILRSKWSPNSEEETDRQRRWFNRGKEIYAKHAALGQKPPKRWRELGIGNGKPEWMLAKQAKPALPALITTARRAPKTNFGKKGEGLSERVL